MNTLHVALAAAGSLAVGSAALAQKAPEVVVEAPHVEKTTQTGPMGRAMPALSIVYRVNYSDLNLATHSGALELESRIKDSAKAACGQLAKLYPDLVEGDPPCVQGAIKKAMAQANKAIAEAEKGAK